MNAPMSRARRIELLMWNFISFFGTIAAGVLFIALAFVLDFRFGCIALVNLALITIGSNTYKYHYWKARPDNPQHIRPEQPFPVLALHKYLNPKNAIAQFRFIDSGSMPSIHSARSFNFAVLFAGYLGDFYWYPLFLIIAAFIGASRIVKLRHDIRDVSVGMLVGIIIGVLSLPWIERLAG